MDNKINKNKEKLKLRNELIEIIKKNLTPKKINEMRDENVFENYIKQLAHRNKLKKLLRKQEIIELKMVT